MCLQSYICKSFGYAILLCYIKVVPDDKEHFGARHHSCRVAINDKQRYALHLFLFFCLVNRWQAMRSIDKQRFTLHLVNQWEEMTHLAPGLRAWWTYYQQRVSFSSCVTLLSLNKTLCKIHLVEGANIYHLAFVLGSFICPTKIILREPFLQAALQCWIYCSVSEALH